MNSKVSNGGWAGKREALRQHDTLLLNSRLLAQVGERTWSEGLIDVRTDELINTLLAIWPVPSGHTGQVVDPRDKSQDWVEIKDLVAAGLLTPGTVLSPRQGGWTPIDAVVREDGMLEVDGQLFASPSRAGLHVKGAVTNGWTFWSLADGRRLFDVRSEFRGEKPSGTTWSSGLPRIEWNEDDLRDYADGAAPLTLKLLDYIADQRTDELLKGSDFAEVELASDQVAGVTGAMARKTYNDYERSNPPIEFIEFEGAWHYRMNAETAATWRTVRSERARGTADPIGDE